ncbi:MAG: hypothetical protein Q9209_005463 [Squamulea sp. 1 TL-2023]
MSSLRFSDTAESPNLVLQPPPNVHSYYASAHSHYIPHHQHFKTVTQSTTASQALAGPSRKRSRDEDFDDTAPLQSKLPRTSGNALCEHGALENLVGGSETSVEGRGRADETVHEPDLDVEMTDDSTTNTLSSNAHNDIRASVTQGSLFRSRDVEGSEVFNRFIMMPPPIRRWVV